MFIVNPNELELHKKISAPLIQDELEYMKSFGMENGDGFITRKEYTLLIIIRIGRVKATVVQQIRKQFQDLLAFHGEKKLLSYEDMQLVSNIGKSFFAISKIFPMRSVDSVEEESNHLQLEEVLAEEDMDSVNIESECPENLVFPEGDGTSDHHIKSRSQSRSTKHNMNESKRMDEGDGDENKNVESDEEDAFDQDQAPNPQLGEMKNKKSKKTVKISNESYRNLTHTTSTKIHLQKVKKVRKGSVLYRACCCEKSILSADSFFTCVELLSTRTSVMRCL